MSDQHILFIAIFYVPFMFVNSFLDLSWNYIYSSFEKLLMIALKYDIFIQNENILSK